MNFSILTLVLIDTAWGVKSAFTKESYLADFFVSQCFNAVDTGLGWWVVDDLCENTSEVIELAKLVGYIRKFATYDVHGAIEMAMLIFGFTRIQARRLVKRALDFTVVRA